MDGAGIGISSKNKASCGTEPGARGEAEKAPLSESLHTAEIARRGNQPGNPWNSFRVSRRATAKRRHNPWIRGPTFGGVQGGSHTGRAALQRGAVLLVHAAVLRLARAAVPRLELRALLLFRAARHLKRVCEGSTQDETQAHDNKKGRSKATDAIALTAVR